MKLPKIDKGQIILIEVDMNTGVILNKDGTFYINEGNNYYQVFNDKVQVEDYITREKKDMSYEILLYDYKWNLLEMKKSNLI